MFEFSVLSLVLVPVPFIFNQSFTVPLVFNVLLELCISQVVSGKFEKVLIFVLLRDDLVKILFGTHQRDIFKLSAQVFSEKLIYCLRVIDCFGKVI